jgi:hypothetical protein
MHRGGSKKQKEEQEEAPAVLPLSTKFLRALREDILKHHKIRRQLDCDHMKVEDLSIIWHIEAPDVTPGGPVVPRAIALYRAASDRYEVHVDQRLKPIKFSVAV